MGVFDLFRKNKNIITDNGLNKIYYDNGKGFIKEQFVKTNGVIDGEFISYEEMGPIKKNNIKMVKYV
jgi:antitoxin component YwqK of YwqJK toxin-antitoxin module